MDPWYDNGRLAQFADALEARHAREAGFRRTGLAFERQRDGYVEVFRIGWGMTGHPILGRPGQSPSACLHVAVRCDDLPARAGCTHASGLVCEVLENVPSSLAFDGQTLEFVVDEAWRHIEATSAVMSTFLPAIRDRAAAGEIVGIPPPKRRARGLASAHKKRPILLGNAQLDALAGRLPTARWQLALSEGDDNFSRAAIADVERALAAFLRAIAQLASSPTRESTLPIVERLVRSLNQVNQRHASVIETLEREELCTFIDDALAVIGVHYETDVTEQWREW